MTTLVRRSSCIVNAPTWDERIARCARSRPTRHQRACWHLRQIARQLYVRTSRRLRLCHAARTSTSCTHFETAYAKAATAATAGFTNVTVTRLAAIIEAEPTVLLPLRVITGLIETEFADSTKIVADPLENEAPFAAKVNSMERSGTATSAEQARVSGRDARSDHAQGALRRAARRVQVQARQA